MAPVPVVLPSVRAYSFPFICDRNHSAAYRGVADRTSSVANAYVIPAKAGIGIRKYGSSIRLASLTLRRSGSGMTKKEIMKLTRCRYCKGKLKTVIALGNIPLVNYFPKPSEVNREKRYPLNFCVCASCGLAQIDYIVPASDIFTHYHYMTGASAPLIDELGKLAESVIKRLNLTPKHHVLDIGSNDGTLLSFFAKKGIGVLGVEPSRVMGRIAERRGVRTVKTFFSQKVAHKIARQYGQFDVIFATHTLANIIDLSDFFRGVGEVLAPTGEMIIEVGYLKTMLEKGQFDAIYHEHYSYFSLTSLSRILVDHGLTIVEAMFPPAQGGSLRIVVKHSSEVAHPMRISEDIQEKDYELFAKRITEFRSAFLTLLTTYKGKSIVGFGAPAKSVILLNYCNIGEHLFSYIVDSTEVKQGRVLPGIHIPIVRESVLKEEQPDVIVMLAWNYHDQIISKLEKLLIRKTMVIIPFPKLHQVCIL
jgi:SAM-dependent methyltransferase